MRKLILLSAALLLCTFAFGQIEKGDVQLGGSVAWNKTTIGDRDVSSFNLLPQAGLFVSPTISLGVTLGFDNSKFDQFDGNTGNFVEAVENQFVFGAYARFHKQISDQFYLYLQPAIRFGSGDRELGGNSDGDISTVDIGLSPGLTYFLSPKFALEMSTNAFNYNQTKREGGTFNQNIEIYTAGLNLSNVNLGINFYIK